MKPDTRKLKLLNKRSIERLAKKIVINDNKERIDSITEILLLRRKGLSYRKIATSANTKSPETVRYWITKAMNLV